MGLRSVFVDFNSYFASVEQQVDPALRGRPVGVAPVMAETTCCIAASVEAKTFGVRTAPRYTRRASCVSASLSCRRSRRFTSNTTIA
jgi:DNA polymerase-4